MDAPTKPILVNHEQAKQVAQIFMRHQNIIGVELFGRTAREGQGNDLDLILVTDVEHGIAFIRECRKGLKRRTRHRGYLEFPRSDTYNNPTFRMEMAQDVLGGNFGELLAECERFTAAPLDIFIFPYTWRDGLGMLQKDLPHKDPNFMENIAHDAVKIA